jgi:hypothetical protein
MQIILLKKKGACGEDHYLPVVVKSYDRHLLFEKGKNVRQINKVNKIQ